MAQEKLSKEAATNVVTDDARAAKFGSLGCARQVES